MTTENWRVALRRLRNSRQISKSLQEVITLVIFESLIGLGALTLITVLVFQGQS
jgi:hypothetical protein